MDDSPDDRMPLLNLNFNLNWTSFWTNWNLNINFRYSLQIEINEEAELKHMQSRQRVHNMQHHRV
jgi:hypothetical protein